MQVEDDLQLHFEKYWEVLAKLSTFDTWWYRAVTTTMKTDEDEDWQYGWGWWKYERWIGHVKCPKPILNQQ